ncbi:MAG: protease HtpX [Proteobacteria bacterium]|nr:protease HtpX [Pseudomonadota bacterium]
MIMKRIVLFLLTNILIVFTLNILISVLGIGHYMTAQGISYPDLAAFCLVWGMTGSFISLALSKVSAKWMMKIQVVEKSSPELGWLVSMIEQLSRKAGLPVTPEIGIYESPEVNAFATGPSKRRSLVAFSTGLLQSMDRNEIEGVAGHEIAHIANGDMVTMTLLQGVVNAFVMFFARIAAWAISQNVREESRHSVQFMTTMVLEILLGILGMLVICAFSRHREFRADKGGAEYAGKYDMIAALKRLSMNKQRFDKEPALATLKIAGGVGRFFATHPPLEDRIKALQAAQ